MLLEYIARFVVGGLLVCLFALISQVCEPKQFAGLFSAAPSVLLAGLVLTLLLKGAASATLTAEGAIAGAVGMIFYCLIATRAIERYKALLGSSVSLIGWLVVSFALFGALSVILRW
ncbi:MAG TPA: DUF3147 family protein [Ktedonobacteraceae bacterium]|nr:DUF3147 family protein [Ktedonobacteraceae bacterium]